MTFGAEIYNGSTVDKITPEDFIHRIWATGSATATGSFTPSAVFVSVAEMNASDEWLVVTAGPQAITLAAGGFYVKNYNLGINTIYYSVYRR